MNPPRLGLWSEIISTTIQVGGMVGAAAISADAQKYAINQETKAALTVELARQQSELEAQMATLEAQKAMQQVAQEYETERTRVTEAGTTQRTTVMTGTAGEVGKQLLVVGGVLGFVALVGYIAMSD